MNEKSSKKSYLKVAVLLLVLLGGGLLLSKNPSLNSGSFKKSSFSAPKLSNQTKPLQNNESTGTFVQSDRFGAPARTRITPDSTPPAPPAPTQPPANQTVQVINLYFTNRDSNSVTLKVNTLTQIPDSEIIGFNIRRVKRAPGGNINGFQAIHSIHSPNWSRSSDGSISLKTGALEAGTEYAFSVSAVYNGIHNGVYTRYIISPPSAVINVATMLGTTIFARAAGSSFYNRFVSDVSTLDDPTSSGRSIDLNCPNQGEHIYSFLMNHNSSADITAIGAKCGNLNAQHNIAQQNSVGYQYPGCPKGSVITGVNGRFEHGNELNAVWPYCRILDTNPNSNQVFSSDHQDLRTNYRGDSSFRLFGITCPDNKVLTGMRLGGDSIRDISADRNTAGQYGRWGLYQYVSIFPDISVQVDSGGIDRLFGIHCADLVKTVR